MNTKNANKYLDGYQINDRSVFDNKDIEHPLDCLLEDYHQEQLKLLNIPVVSVSLPSVDDAGIIAVEISEINNEMTAQEQAFFIAGFSECIKYLEMQSNER